ncbi:MAG: UDP-N-acetylmuramoyl-L-alanyl-D-glutamate--2,6-diaminopimelate ligase [Patescibacteria group bacterium]|mgnify:CR=1 FL=1
MRLDKLLADFGITETDGGPEIIGITDDSRKVKPGYLFVAVKGLEHDGHKYIEQAIMAGACAVVFDVKSKVSAQGGSAEGGKSQKSKFSGTIFVGVRGSRKALGLLWAAWYGYPAKSLRVIGVTGTDGKTTTANLIYHLLKSAGKKVGLISTINAQIGNDSFETGFHVTNPEPELLQKFLRLMVDRGTEFAVLEVTSHGIDQERIAGIGFEIAVVTNVAREHLDYHKTYENYLNTKGRLLASDKVSILNRDDSSFSYLKSVSGGEVLSYGIHQKADFQATKVTLLGESAVFTLEPGSVEVKINLPGEYNIANALAAAAAAFTVGLSGKQVAAGLQSFQTLPGRFEEIKTGRDFRVVVDFAHTPNALESVLSISRKILIIPTPLGSRLPDPKDEKPQEPKLIVVFGCAGERDSGKRPLMGEIAGRLADISILTAEDPRREDVNGIIEQIAAGCQKSGEHIFIKEPDRRKAIELAINMAKAGDLIIITGKGHEKSMCFGTTEYPWSDQEVAKGILERNNK